MGPALEAIWKKNYSVYGERKLTKAAKRHCLEVGRDEVARLMRQQGIRGASRAKRRFTTHADATHPRAPDLVQRNFSASCPDALWVADFTYCSTWSGVVYVAFIIDIFSRRLVGWRASRSMSATLVVDALKMAAWTMRYADLEELMCHTDAGSQPNAQRCANSYREITCNSVLNAKHEDHNRWRYSVSTDTYVVFLRHSADFFHHRSSVVHTPSPNEAGPGILKTEVKIIRLPNYFAIECLHHELCQD